MANYNGAVEELAERGFAFEDASLMVCPMFSYSALYLLHNYSFT